MADPWSELKRLDFVLGRSLHGGGGTWSDASDLTVEENCALWSGGHNVGLVHFGVSVDWHWVCYWDGHLESDRAWNWVRLWDGDWYWIWDILYNWDWYRHNALTQVSKVDSLNHGVASYGVSGSADVNGMR